MNVSEREDKQVSLSLESVSKRSRARQRVEGLVRKDLIVLEVRN